MSKTMTQEQLENIIFEACTAANDAAKAYIKDTLNWSDTGACGFAWVRIVEFEGKQIKGNTKVGRLLKKCGISQNYARLFEIWNPSAVHFQNVDCKLVGAQAAAEVFKQYGFKAYAGSRLD